MWKKRLKTLKSLSFPQLNSVSEIISVENVKFSTLLTDFSTFMLNIPADYSLCTLKMYIHIMHHKKEVSELRRIRLPADFIQLTLIKLSASTVTPETVTGFLP